MTALSFAVVSEATRKSMRANKSKDTKLEISVRRLIYAMGYRYRLHRKDLPGKPDLAFGSRRKVIFIHGCFWHLHSESSCKGARVPKSRVDYWRPKLEGNRARDRLNVLALEEMHWRVLTLWECELKNAEKTAFIIRQFLDQDM